MGSTCLVAILHSQRSRNKVFCIGDGVVICLYKCRGRGRGL